MLPYVRTPSNPDADLEPDDEDSAPAMPRCVVVDERFDWEDDRPPRAPLGRHGHLRDPRQGLHDAPPEVREDLRGTYAGAGLRAGDRLPAASSASPPSSCCRSTTSSTTSFLLERGLRNYWGYSSIGYFAPHSGYAATGARGEQVREFKGMVKALHRAGIEVILDVVYNHTAEGNHLGPMLSLPRHRQPRLLPADARRPAPLHGLHRHRQLAQPRRTRRVLQLIMDSLRYWVIEMHVDGFRFDLAAALAREFYDVDRLSAFFDVIHQDPVLSQVKLIAEPWDVGPGGYQVGNFPVLWSEWNGKYRDAVRDFWRGDASVGEFASRLTGSSDLYQADGRRPYATINFVTAHDGFTLRDLVSYNDKHNEANGEDNRDGTDDNRSWNCGVEGPTDDPRDPRAARAPAAQLPGDAAPLAGRADAARRRRARPHPAGQQQRLVPGQRASPGTTGSARTGSSSCSPSPAG